MRTVLWATAGVLGAGVAALLAVEIVHRVVRRLSRRSALLGELAVKAHRPLQVLVTAYALQLALRALVRSFPAREEILHGVGLALIAAAGWLLGALLLVFEDVALARFGTDVPDNLRRRRLHTQVTMIRRVTVAAVAVLAAGVALMTFREVRAIGASVLASAGIVGVIAGLAAQSILSNVFAGLQLTFSDAIRLDDVVVVEGEWGKIEEITLSHVVVRIWDDRRLILPTSYFTNTPFENWTRSSAALLGTVELEVDWAVPVPAMREELSSFVDGVELWDRRVCVLQVTDAQGGAVRLRALVSAADAPTLWDLRCLVREHLVGWVRDHHPHALPRLRAELEGVPVPEQRDGVRTLDRRDSVHAPDRRDEVGTSGRRDGGRTPDRRGGAVAERGGAVAEPDGTARRGRPSPGEAEEREHAGVFSGSDDGEARASAFGGPHDPASPRDGGQASTPRDGGQASTPRDGGRTPDAAAD